MARKSNSAPMNVVESLSNEQHINILLQLGHDNDAIMYCLVQMKDNLAAVEDDSIRVILSTKFGVECPSFNKLFHQRLLEQIRKCKCAYKEDSKNSVFLEESTTDFGARSLVEIPREQVPRFSCGIPDLDKVFGTGKNGVSGIPTGSITTFGSVEKVGKTRLMVVLSKHIAMNKEVDERGNSGVLYFQNEEYPSYFLENEAKSWTNDMNIRLSSNLELNNQLCLIREHKPKFVVIDSVQYTSQARYKSGLLVMMMAFRDLARERGTSFCLVSHLNNDGKLSGGNFLREQPDISLVARGDETGLAFFVECTHNRYGSTSSRPVFIHTDTGVVPASMIKATGVSSVYKDTVLA